MQKISSIHTLTQQILGSHELNGHTHFWPCPPKNQGNNFQLSWICTCMQKISWFYTFIIEVQSTLESHEQTGHTHFWPYPPKYFLINFNIYEFVEWIWEFDLFSWYGWLKNPAIWLAEKIMAYISGTKIVSNMGFVQKHSKLYKFSLQKKFIKSYRLFEFQ